MPHRTRLRVALDWTPNVLHAGLFVGLNYEWYTEAGLMVQVVLPDADGYKTTPARRLVQGGADIAFAPSESVVSLHTLDAPFACAAIAAVSQRDTSAIVVREGGPCLRPRDLDGRTYASYAARFEDGIVRAMVRADGGMGNVKVVYPPRLGVMDTLFAGVADATWVFMPWEGVWAKRQGRALRGFTLDEVGIPYGYSPVLIAPDAFRLAHPEAVRAFLEVTARGYTLAAQHPEEAARCLKACGHETVQDLDFLTEAFRAQAHAFLDADGRWGTMDLSRWEAFVGWLAHEQLLRNRAGELIAAPRVEGVVAL